MFKPQSLTQVFEQARLQEMSIEAIIKRQRMSGRSMNMWEMESGRNTMDKERMRSFSNGKTIQSNAGNIGFNRVTTNNATTSNGRNEELERKRSCYKCGDRYFVGHTCKKQLLTPEAEEYGTTDNEFEDNKKKYKKSC